MSTDQKQYTFEDWDSKKFALPRFPEDGKISMYELNQQLSHEVVRDLPLALYKIGRMSKEEFDKIRAKQKKAYQILFDYHVNQATNNIQEHSTDESYLRRRKAYIEKTIEETDTAILKEAADDPDLTRLSSSICDQIINRNNEGKPQHGYERIDKNTDTGKIIREYRLSESFEISILQAELAEIEVHLKKSNEDNENLLKEFVNAFSTNTNYSSDYIYTYLKAYEKCKSLPEFRKKTKNRLSTQGIYDFPSDGTLFLWEKNWKEFRDPRT